MTFEQALKQGEQYLSEKEVPDAAIDAWYLMEYTEKKEGRCIDRTWYFLHSKENMPQSSYDAYQNLLVMRGKRIPLQHITGTQEFMGFEFKVNEHVLIPRQDTEILVEEACKHLKSGMRVLDMCTGSGCIIISLMKLVPGISGTASDLSGEALETARENARNHQISIDFIKGDLFESAEGIFDVIVSNPPYIPSAEIECLMPEVRLYDPIQALDGKEDGLYFYRCLTAEARDYLKPGGWLLMEIGCAQGKEVSDMLLDAGYRDVKVIKDLTGLHRVAGGRRG